jgi:hypothetical protein
MTYQIFAEIKPDAGQTQLMYTSPGGSNSGVQGQILLVNQGNPEVNNGNIALDFGRDSDYVRIAISPDAVPAPESYIAYDTVVIPGHMAQWQDLCIQSTGNVFVYSLKGWTSFTFTGFTIAS